MPAKSKYHHRMQMYLGHFELFLLEVMREHYGGNAVDHMRAAVADYAASRGITGWDKRAKAYRQQIDDPDLLRAFDERVKLLLTEAENPEFDSQETFDGPQLRRFDSKKTLGKRNV